MELEELKYPVGKFSYPTSYNQRLIQGWISEIDAFPEKLRNEVAGLENELDWRYRPDGWNIRQVVHHCADSHMNALIRFKMALTESNPEVKGYLEDRVAELDDSTKAPIEWSLNLISGLHSRWVMLLTNLGEEDLKRTYYHAQYKKAFELRAVIALYAWHCNHHLGHIRQAKESGGQFN